MTLMTRPCVTKNALRLVRSSSRTAQLPRKSQAGLVSRCPGAPRRVAWWPGHCSVRCGLRGTHACNGAPSAVRAPTTRARLYFDWRSGGDAARQTARRRERAFRCTSWHVSRAEGGRAGRGGAPLTVPENQVARLRDDELRRQLQQRVAAGQRHEVSARPLQALAQLLVSRVRAGQHEQAPWARDRRR